MTKSFASVLLQFCFSLENFKLAKQMLNNYFIINQFSNQIKENCFPNRHLLA